jgi:serine phosphatase RsbU (regulator of sigma subunit)
MRITGTIRNKLIASFTGFMLISCGVIVITLWLESRKNKIEKVLFLLNQVNQKVQKANQLEKDFFAGETINPNFYKTGKSRYLTEHTVLVKEIHNTLLQLRYAKENINFHGVFPKIDRLITDFVRYEQVFNELVALIKHRGFKDYGLEGKMREHIHAIETSIYPVDMVQLLTIRRHEKDFIIRKEEKYISQLNQAVDAFEEAIRRSVRRPQAERELVSLLRQYRQTFIAIFDAEYRIGIDNNSGLRGKLSVLSLEIEQTIEQINRITYKEAELVRQTIRRTLWAVMVVSVLLSIALATYLSNLLSRPIRTLSASIHLIIQNNFDRNSHVARVDSNDEVGQLSKDMAAMLAKVQDSIEQVTAQKMQLERTQEKLTDSLRYAQKIQEAVMADESELQDYLQDYFVIYLPKNIVSGDFFWLAKKENLLFVAVVDCTGHGVPGAFMASIGITLLNKIINELHIYDPATVLDVLDLELKQALHQKENKNDDGMDVCLCAIRSEENSDLQHITFSGARRSLAYISDGQLTHLKGVKRSVGGKVRKRDELGRSFENQYFTLKSGDLMYLTSDGFGDQPNEAGEKYGSARLYQFISELSAYTLAEQKKLLLQEFETVKGQGEQRDDVTILGIKL